ncbi:hypothetical protein EYY93_01885 [Hafnia paralvei]|uniref:DotI/IcmL/TraM family protein n=1 Tax=Hafniaceae TaxID=1903412 RepID=UPI00061CFF72|nr:MULTISPECIES: DotI/IcmL/TraM family protein [Hafniaceae]KKF38527.1 hypothetical protein PU01_22990 [Hafnia alvei]MBW3478368.1 DotI/IcmL family type IV secretion protein [Hafnia alvei]MCE9871057.1 DotI/IcmL family type IV secretion protein [Hafnia alvei]MDX6842970.1 DotI/IcmL/TraM family protein [Hafnia paralvei]TBM06184.1 hypothetical protein EYY93_01885 [Hafnia paralvei]
MSNSTEGEKQNSTTEDSNYTIVQTKVEVTALERLLAEAKAAITLANRLSRTVLLLSVANISLSLILVISVLVAINTDIKYFATSPDGSLTPIIPLDQPVITDNGIKIFTRDTLYDVLNLDFDTYREDLEKGRDGFTDKGLADMINAVKNAGIIDIMTKERVNTRTEFSTAIISKKGIKNKVAYWEVQIPITISFVGQNTTSKPMKFILIATLNSVEKNKNAKGVAISQVVTIPQK